MWNLSFGKNIECAIEAILFSMGEAVEVERIAEALEVREDEVREAFTSLKQKYEEEKRGIRLIEIDNSPEPYTLYLTALVLGVISISPPGTTLPLS